MIQLHQRPIGVSRSQYREIYIESRPAITWIFQNILGGKAVLDGLRHVQIGSWHGNVRRNSNRNWHFLHLAPEGQDWVCDPFGYVQILGGYINFPISISFSLCTHALTYIYMLYALTLYAQQTYTEICIEFKMCIYICRICVNNCSYSVYII